MERLRRRFPHTLQLLFDPDETESGPARSYASRVRGRTDLEIAEGFVRHVRPGTEPDDAELRWLREGFERHPRERRPAGGPAMTAPAGRPAAHRPPAPHRRQEPPR
ncbi:hypothetical protein ACFSUJ_34975 [Streptomyces lusitanus]|uniref:hypothetical protein n=1 Tax=Streptomyces lusitanus TaxID=68232 RepID=UPI00362714E0